MPGNRKAAEQVIVSLIEEMTPGSDNANMYRRIFKVMTDKDFDSLMDDLESGKRHLHVVAPNFDKCLQVERNLKIADRLGYDFFQPLWIEGEGDQPSYLTPIKYMVMDVPGRRASQMLIKKISVPKHNRAIDALTGQPTGESKGAKISYPELGVCAAMGLENCMVELMKYRGGDIKGNAALTAVLSKYGSASLKTLEPYASGVVSTQTLRTFLICAGIKSNL